MRPCRSRVVRHVQREGPIGLREPLEQSVLEHRLRAARPLFGRLSDAHDRAGPAVAVIREPPRDRDQVRHVEVVSARVHHAGDTAVVALAAHDRLVPQPGALPDRQRIEVRAQHQRAAYTVLEHADHPEAADVPRHVEARRLELVRDACRRLHLAERQLRVPVQVPVELDERRHLCIEPRIDVLRRQGERRQEAQQEGGPHRDDGSGRRTSVSA